MHLTTERKRRRLAKYRLAILSGVHQSTIGRIESGQIRNPSSATVARLEDTLGIRRGSLTFDRHVAHDRRRRGSRKKTAAHRPAA